MSDRDVRGSANKNDGNRKERLGIVLMLTAAAVVLTGSLWGPEFVAEYWNRNRLNKVMTEQTENDTEGYRYTLGSNEKLYILSKCISNQDAQGSYALVVNRQGPSDREITEEDIFDVCNAQLRKMKEQKILPDAVREVEAGAYTAVLYSAIDVLEPGNHLSVWKISLSTDTKNADKSGRMLDAFIDAETGKIYEFYVRTSTTWEEMDPAAMTAAWADYLGLTGPERYESDNPLLENTPYYEKFRFEGIGEDNTVVTIGFYEGINELFLKISK